MKHAVRLINFVSQRAHSKPLFKKLRLLCLEDSYKNECATFMFDINNNRLEKHFSDLFQLTSSKHSIRTRQATSGSFSQPIMRTNSLQNSVINNGVKIWNNIPKDIRL